MFRIFLLYVFYFIYLSLDLLGLMPLDYCLKNFTANIYIFFLVNLDLEILGLIIK